MTKNKETKKWQEMHVHDFAFKSNGRGKMDVEQATEYLKAFGLSTSENVTRRLIREGKIKHHSGTEGSVDRRSGYLIEERSLYQYVVKEIPVMRQIIPVLEEYKQLEMPMEEK